MGGCGIPFFRDRFSGFPCFGNGALEPDSGLPIEADGLPAVPARVVFPVLGGLPVREDVGHFPADKFDLPFHQRKQNRGGVKLFRGHGVRAASGLPKHARDAFRVAVELDSDG